MKQVMVAMIVALALVLPRWAQAHCDTMDGPVIIEAQAAMEKGDLTPLLKWVKAGHEAEVREAWEHNQAVRKAGGEARELADRYFLETLVRVHREGENAPYTGIKPAGLQEPTILAADKALESANFDALETELINTIKAGLRERFDHTVAAKAHAGHTVDAGREFVAAYVEYMHYIERLHRDAVTPAVHTEGHDEHAKAAAPACGHK